MKNKRNNLVLLIVCGLIIAAGIFLLPYLVYYYFSPEKLIRKTAVAIEQLTGTRIIIKSAELSFWKGLTFRGVQVRVPESKTKDFPAFNDFDSLLLKADVFHVKLKRKGVFGLSFKPADLTVINPELNFSHDLKNDMWNWQMLFRSGPSQGKQLSKRINPRLPLTIRDGLVNVTDISGSHRSPINQVGFSVAVAPGPLSTLHFYNVALSVKTKSKPVHASFTYDLQTGTIISGEVKSFDMGEVINFLPEPWKNQLARLYISGNVSIPTIKSYNNIFDASVNVEKASLKLPLTSWEYDHESPKGLLNLSHLTGSVQIQNNKIRIAKLTGMVNSSPITISGDCSCSSLNFDTMTFTANIEGKEFECPDINNPEVRNYINTYLPWSLGVVFRDYKPIGKFDYSLNIEKKADCKLKLKGSFFPKGLSVEYYKVPYRADNITGTIRTDGRRFELTDIRGISGTSKLLVNGVISEPTSQSAISLSISTVQTPIDQKLYRAIFPRHQEIWKKFNPSGSMDVQLKLERPHGNRQPWDSTIVLSLSNASASYEKFNYPLKNLWGSIVIHNENLTIRNLSGRNDPAEFILNGTVDNYDSSNPSVNLNISSQGLPIDKKISEHLPRKFDELISRTRLKGNTDLSGFIHITPDNKMNYSFICDLRSASMKPQDFPYPLDNVSGKLTIMPGRMTINELYSLHGNQRISIRGEIYDQVQNKKLTLSLHAGNLSINPSLRDALPPKAKRIWKDLNPKGSFDAVVELEGEADKLRRWVITLEPKSDFEVQYKSFPVISNVSGSLTIKPDEIVFLPVSAKLDYLFPLRWSGKISFGDNYTRLALNDVLIGQLPIQKEFFTLMGNHSFISRLGWKPGGHLEGKLKTFRINFYPGEQEWNLDGDVSLIDVAVELFNPHLTPKFNFRGNIGWKTSSNEFGMDGDVFLKNFSWKNRIITDLQAKCFKLISESNLDFTTIRGSYAEGLITGIGNLKFTKPKTSYGLQLTLDNLEAAETLALNNPRQNIKGKLKGELYLTGFLDEKYAQMGGGVFQISGAEALKIPMMAKIYQNIRQDPPNLATFHDVIVQFILEKHRAGLQHIELTSPTWSLIGTGHLNLSNNRLAMEFISSAPKEIKKIPVLPEIMHGASREATRIEVHGTLSNPIITVVPLKDISDTLETFFEGKDVR
jgi:hypothetical protein